MKNLFMIVAILLMSSMAYGAAKKEAPLEKKIVQNKNVKKIKVHGMACPLCQSKAEKKFKEVPAVNSVEVDMEKMLITLNLKDGMDLSIKKIEPIVESLGLTFVKVIK